MHNLTNVNEQERTAICETCGPVFIHSRGIQVRQSHTYRRWRCGNQANNQNKNRRYSRDKRKDKCERCQFTPEHIGQLDIHHLDGNHLNNSPSNLQTLCANCHRLVTILSRQLAGRKKKLNPLAPL